MKLALIHHQLAPGGGMETYFVDLIQECLRQGHSVDVYVRRKSPDFKLPAAVEIHVLPNRIWPKFLRKFYFAWQVKKLLKQQKYDLTLSTTRSFGQDVIITGGTHKGYLKSHRRLRLSDPIEAFFESKAYHSAKKVIAHSPQIERELLELYKLPREKVQMLYPPVDKGQFHFKPHAPHQPFRLLFASTSHRRKGGYLLLEALKLLPAEAFELWIAGRSFKEAKQLKQKVKFLGYVKDMNTLYQEVDLLVLPSYFEPFGLVVAQALECGTPVLVSQSAGVTALISHQEGLILQEQSSEALKALLLRAKAKHFTVEKDFIARNKLGLAEHIMKLLAP